VPVAQQQQQLSLMAQGKETRANPLLLPMTRPMGDWWWRLWWWRRRKRVEGKGMLESMMYCRRSLPAAVPSVPGGVPHAQLRGPGTVEGARSRQSPTMLVCEAGQAMVLLLPLPLVKALALLHLVPLRLLEVALVPALHCVNVVNLLLHMLLVYVIIYVSIYMYIYIFPNVCVVCFCVSAAVRLFVMCLIIHARRGWGTTQ
jgi:hypothetical protein